MTNVLVFRTNIDTSQRVHKAACRLCKLRTICRWSVDLDHADCLLRIESDLIDPQAVVRVLTKAGLECQFIIT